MAHTSEERDKLSTPLCGAKKKNGSRCRAFAGQGTDHPGFGTCKYHGGATPSANKHALKLQAKQQMVKFGGPLDVQPTEALLGLLRATAGHVNWLSAEIQELDDLGGEDAKVLLSMYDSERDRLTHISEACVRSGVNEKHLIVQRERASLVAELVREAAKEAGLSAKQVKALGAGMQKLLAQATADEDPEANLARVEQADRNLQKLRAEIEAEQEARIATAAAKRPPQDLTYPPEEWTPPEEPAPA